MNDAVRHALAAYADFRELPKDDTQELIAELLTDLRALCATGTDVIRFSSGVTFNDLLTESGNRFEEQVYGKREDLEAEHLREMKRVFGYGPTQQYIDNPHRRGMDCFILRESIAKFKAMPDHPEPRRIPLPVNPRYRENSERTYRENALPCVVCGKHIDEVRQRKTVHVVDGGVNLLVAEDDKLWDPHDPALMAGDMCYFPLGPDCLRSHPELKAAVLPKEG